MIVNRFTPSLMPRETLERIFVARQPILNAITGRIADAAETGTLNHTLLVGPRGAGKTHLISLAYYYTRDLIAAGHRIQVSWLPEDPWRIASYSHLLASVIDRLEAEPQLPRGRRNAEELEALLVELAQRQGPVVMLVENLDYILNRLGEHGQQQLRHLLQSQPSLLVIGTTTRLDRDLSDQARPFYGYFTTTRLQPFNVSQAQEMLQALALESGDVRLAEQLQSEVTTARLRTIAHLAGGQPRLWAALSGALTIEGLDTLTDLFLSRFDDLTPYYQEQLGRLSPQQLLITAELADADHPVHVAELATLLDIDQRSLSKTISELVDRGWITPVQTPLADLLDRRRTYYELAEPLARISFQIKESRGEPLKVVVDFLKGWFDPEELRDAATTLANAYVVEAAAGLDGDPVLKVTRQLRRLPVNRAPAAELLGVVDDALAQLIGEGTAGLFLRLPITIRTAIEERLNQVDTRRADLIAVRTEVHRSALAEFGHVPHPATLLWRRRAESLVNQAGQSTAQLVLSAWHAVSWQFEDAGVILDAAMRPGTLTVDDLHFGWTQLAYSLSAAGQDLEAVAVLGKLLTHEISMAGHDHPRTLITRSNLAFWRGQAGDHTGAVTAYEELLIDKLRILGPDHPDILETVSSLSFLRGQAGDHTGAVTAYEELLIDKLRTLGPDHPDTLTTRSYLAFLRGVAGDRTGAVTAYEELLIGQLRVLGPDHPDTLTTRSYLAFWLGHAGNPAEAVTTHKEVLTDQRRILGPDHPDTLTTRSNLAFWRGEAGDHTGAVTGYEELLVDQRRVLGPDHPDTLTTRSNLARWRGHAGNSAEAVTTYKEVLTDQRRVLGPDHPDTLTSRSDLARWRGEAGDLTGAVTAYEELLRDRLRILGPGHPDTLTTRNNLARWRREVGK